jgi:hypothetical protein
MKIGILTLPLRTNYGGILQAYALMETLKKMGHDVLLINRKHNKIPKWKSIIIIIKRIIFKILFNSKKQIFKEKKDKNYYDYISINTQKFINKYIIPQTIPFYSSSELKKINFHNYDAIIVGSDQVWRPTYPPNLTDSFLGFLNDNISTKRIAYAASFGTDKWEFTLNETKVCKDLLQKFNSVSTREDSGVDLCYKYFDITSQHVLDPTMLLCSKDYLKLLVSSDCESNLGELLVYFLDESQDKLDVVGLVETTLNYKPFRNYSKNTIENESLEDRIIPSIENWIKGFYDAKFVVTDSFHGCVFSILFNKPFLAYGNSNRGMARFESLLKTFSLEDRIIMSYKELTIKNIQKPINWENVNYTLEQKKKKSLQFLVDSIKNA